MTNLICTKETAKKLADRGLDVDTELRWWKNYYDAMIVEGKGYNNSTSYGGKKRANLKEKFSAPTLTEALKLLPESLAPHPEDVLQIRKRNGKWKISYGTDVTLFVDDRLVEAACKLLLHLDDENIISLENL
jgi:hypothetical protein